MTKNAKSVPEELRIRHQFVGMLFALTIGQIAIYYYELTSIPDFGGRRFAALAHLVLCTLLVMASWVGWSRSSAPGTRQHVEGVFSWPFIVLILDVLLVVLYFIIVRKVEIGNSLLGGSYLGRPSAREEAFWMIWVFVVYALWDIVADVIVVICSAGRSSSGVELFRAPTRLSGLIAKRSFASFVCLFLALVAYYTTANHVRGVWAVVLTDLALIVLVFLFRALKPLEKVLRCGSSAESQDRRRRDVVRENPGVAWLGRFLAVFAVCLVVAHSLELEVK